MARQAESGAGSEEHVIREASISWWSLWPRLVLGLAGAALAGWGAWRQDDLGYGLALLGAIVFLAFFVGALMRRGALSLRLTDRYLVLRTGIVGRHTSTVMLNRVESLDVDQTLWQRMTRSGTLTIRGTGSEDLRIVGIADPVGFQADARRAINLAGGGGV